MMKTIFVFVFFLLVSCDDTRDVNDQKMGSIPCETSLNLVSPNGVAVASSINALKEKLSIVDNIVTKIEFANPEDFNFSDDKKGYLALVYYIDDNNRETNLAVAEGKFAELLLKCKSENK